jgi:protein tyrosine/serine phosphatase
MKKSLRNIAATFLLIGLPIGGYALFTKATGNFHEVARGAVYRSAQLTPTELREKADALGIKSVLNLRGKNQGKDWYDKEVSFCESRGIRHYDVPISAGKDVSQKRMDEIVGILKSAPKPLLIHCLNGADRAAFGAALYHLAVEGKPPAEADDELTVWYGHIPFITPHVAAMDRSFWCYAESLKTPHP